MKLSMLKTRYFIYTTCTLVAIDLLLFKYSNKVVTRRRLLPQGFIYYSDYVEKSDKEHDRVRESNYEMDKVFTSIKTTIEKLYTRLHVKYDYCPSVPAALEGPINFRNLFKNTNLADLANFYAKLSDKPMAAANASLLKFDKEKKSFDLLDQDDVYGEQVQWGGSWAPSDCFSRTKTAVIIPYRDRFVHLAVLLRSLHSVLQRQQIDYRIFVTELNLNVSIPFNKGRIMNAAYLEALKIDPDLRCFIFHDVDLILEDDRNLHTCHTYPKHMSVAIDKFDYLLPYPSLIGGVLAIRTEKFALVNGYSNSYWGWGGEDDDMYERLNANNLLIVRPPSSIGRYRMAVHNDQKRNMGRFKILEVVHQNYKMDGVKQVNYTVVRKTLHRGFTHFLLDVGLPELQSE